MKIKKYKIISKVVFWLMFLQVMMVIWILILAVTWLVLNIEKKECPQSFVTEKDKALVEEVVSEPTEQINDQQDMDKR